MLKFPSIISVLVLCAGGGAHGNEIKNGDFTRGSLEEIKLSASAGVIRMSLHTEELSWNQCVKLELVKHGWRADKTKSYAGTVRIGMEETLSGVPVEPDSSYTFSVELKGTMNRVWINALGWSSGVKGEKGTKLASSLGIVQVQSDWVKYQGRFKTQADTKRASLAISIWGDEKEKDLPDKEGSYLLIDNVSLEKAGESCLAVLNAPGDAVRPVHAKRAVIAMDARTSPVLDGKLDEEAWKIASPMRSFRSSKNAAATPTEARVIAGKDALWLGITCAEPHMPTLRASYAGDGGEAIWRDDEVEVFFGTAKPGGAPKQFVVSAGGGRWMNWGAQQARPAQKDYRLWEARTSKADSSWTAEIRIAYAAIDLPKRPERGFTLPFNIARQRKAAGGEASSWSAVKGSPANAQYYGVLAFDSLRNDLETRLGQVKRSSTLIRDVSDKDRAKLEKAGSVIAKWEKSLSAEPTAESWAEAYVALEQAKAEIEFLRLKKLTFALTAISPYKTDFTIPVLPETISADYAPISCRAAVNEFKGMPILITNLSAAAQEYRVFLYFKEIGSAEAPGLKEFPPGKITMRRGVMVKNSDGPEHGQMFDPLVRMNEAMTMLVLPRESGLVWLTFDCSGVKPGTYGGFLRVIPLNEPGKYVHHPKQGKTYEGAMRDVPFALEVLPIELSRDPVVPQSLFCSARNESHFKDLIEHDARIFHLSAWLFHFEFTPDGDITPEANKGRLDGFRRHIRRHQEWADKYEIHPQYFVGGAYKAFREMTRFAFGTPEGTNAWKNWVRQVEKAFREAGVDSKDYFLEVYDEPRASKYGEVIENYRLAKEASANTRTVLAFGHPKHPDADMVKLIPYLDVWCFWRGLYNAPDLQVTIDKLRAAKKEVWMYDCETSSTLPLYKYYRLFAWKGSFLGNTGLILFWYMDNPGGYYAAPWKSLSYGALAYDSFGTPVPSIRFECFREGITDIKYLKKLEEVAQRAKSANVADALVKEAMELAGSASYVVAEKHSTDADMADRIRNRAIDLILGIQKEL